MIKLIATDIDGTLLPDGTIYINPEYYTAITEFRKRGGIFVAASGRQRNSIERVFEPIKDDIITISENGTCIHSKDYKYVDQIDPDIVKAFVGQLRENEAMEIGINQDNISYFETEGIYHVMSHDYGYIAKMVDDILDYGDKACKVSGYHPTDAEGTVGEDFMKKWSQNMHITSSGACWIDLMNVGVNKGSAIRKLQEHFGIAPDETLAFGDNDNDIEMMHSAVHSFAVENAKEGVKEAANFEARSYKEDGVLQVIKAVLKGGLC